MAVPVNVADSVYDPMLVPWNGTGVTADVDESYVPFTKYLIVPAVGCGLIVGAIETGLPGKVAGLLAEVNVIVVGR